MIFNTSKISVISLSFRTSHYLSCTLNIIINNTFFVAECEVLFIEQMSCSKSRNPKNRLCYIVSFVRTRSTPDFGSVRLHAYLGDTERIRERSREIERFPSLSVCSPQVVGGEASRRKHGQVDQEAAACGFACITGVVTRCYGI